MEFGLDPREMIEIYNQAYTEIWEECREKVDWDAANIDVTIQGGEEINISRFVLQLLEAVMTSARDAMIITLLENNRRIRCEMEESGAFMNGRETGADEVIEEEYSPVSEMDAMPEIEQEA